MSYAAYVTEASPKMARKSGRNMSQNHLIIKKCCTTSWYWNFINIIYFHGRSITLDLPTTLHSKIF